MIKGQIFGARDRKKSGEVAKDRAPKFSFDEGLQVLPDTLAAQLADAVKLNTAVFKLTQATDGWRVMTSNGEVEHSAVIYCGTAHKLAELQVELGVPASDPVQIKNGNTPNRSSALQAKPDLSSFSEIRHPPVASVVLGFRREDVAHPCEGFGMLIPKIEGFKILGTIFSSSLFPNRAPAGHVTLTSYVGGERYPELALVAAGKALRTDRRRFAGVARGARPADVSTCRGLSESDSAIQRGLWPVSRIDERP